MHSANRIGLLAFSQECGALDHLRVHEVGTEPLDIGAGQVE